MTRRVVVDAGYHVSGVPLQAALKVQNAIGDGEVVQAEQVQDVMTDDGFSLGVLGHDDAKAWPDQGDEGVMIPGVCCDGDVQDRQIVLVQAFILGTRSIDNSVDIRPDVFDWQSLVVSRRMHGRDKTVIDLIL